jgi:hypothetical protein
MYGAQYRQSGLIWLGINRTVGFHKHGNERMGYTKVAELLDQLTHYQILLLHGFGQT